MHHRIYFWWLWSNWSRKTPQHNWQHFNNEYIIWWHHARNKCLHFWLKNKWVKYIAFIMWICVLLVEIKIPSPGSSVNREIRKLWFFLYFRQSMGNMFLKRNYSWFMLPCQGNNAGQVEHIFVAWSFIVSHIGGEKI